MELDNEMIQKIVSETNLDGTALTAAYTLLKTKLLNQIMEEEIKSQAERLVKESGDPTKGYRNGYKKRAKLRWLWCQCEKIVRALTALLMAGSHR